MNATVKPASIKPASIGAEPVRHIGRIVAIGGAASMPADLALVELAREMVLDVAS